MHKSRRHDPVQPGDRKYRGGKSVAVPVYNGILEHCDKIGEALWEFYWCLNAVTKEINGVGLVFGGAPVKLERISRELQGRDPETIRRHLKKLEKAAYIRMRRTPYGQVIEVLNSRKFGIWKPKNKPQPQPAEKPQITVSLHRDADTEKPQNAVSLESKVSLEKLTGVDEKPQFAASKEESEERISKASDDFLPSGLTSGVAGAEPPGKTVGGEGDNNHPTSQNQTTDDCATPVSIVPASPVVPKQTKSSLRESNKAKAVLVKRGHDPEFIDQVFALIGKLARTTPMTSKYFVSSFDNDSIDDWKARIKIKILHECVETAASTGRTATELMLERLPEEFP